MTTIAPPATTKSATSQSAHLPFLDGIRALAAIYVLLFHLTTVVPQKGLAPWIKTIILPFRHGHFAVGIFIVLSGFVLMLPVVRSEDGQLRGGLREYFRRRGRRILVPYYAALILSIPSDLYKKHLHHEPFAWKALLAHFLVVHNFRPDWIFEINSPLWSVAVEWQIYFVFALILLPLWRRAGVSATLALSFALGLSPLLLPSGKNLAWSCPWFLGLFGLGMFAAHLTFARDSALLARVARVPWGVLSLVTTAFLLADLSNPAGFAYPANDVLLGFAFCFFIIYGVYTHRRQASNSPLSAAERVFRYLGNPKLVLLSTFSYSIYLLHFPILSSMDTVFKRFVHSPNILMAFQIFIVFPACLIAAYFFSQVFEKPFMSSRSAPGRRAVGPANEMPHPATAVVTEQSPTQTAR